MKKLLILILLSATFLLSGCGKEDTKLREWIIKGEDSLTAPKSGQGSITSRYMSGFQTQEGFEWVKEDVSWKIVSTSDGASVNEIGILFITEDYNAGDANGTDLTMEAVATIDGEEFVARKTVHVSPAIDVENFASIEGLEALSVEREPDESKYIYVNQNTTGLSSLDVDVSGMVNFSNGAVYQVTLALEDGTVEQFDEVAGPDGTIELTLKNVKAVEVSPVFRFSFGNKGTETLDNSVWVDADTEYDATNLFGFVGNRRNADGYTILAGGTGHFAFVLPEGYYSIRLYKGATNRSTVTVNGASLGTNVGNPGTGGREGITPYTYYMEDAHITGGRLFMTLGEKDLAMAGLEIRRTTTLKPRRIHVYIGGDSTASNYYPIEKEVPMKGRFQTGWGQVFAQYVTGDTAVTNIAGGGTYAKMWYDFAFSGVTTHGEAGDIFLIEAGLNDRTYSSQEEMADYLGRMIDECREKGIIPVVVTAQQCPKFWKDPDGNEVGDFDKPYGSSLNAFADTIREVANAKGAFLIDVAAFTTDLYSKLGRIYVAHNFHIYNPETDLQEDGLHLSYDGAVNVAGFIATTLYDYAREGKTDATGATLDGLKLNPITTTTYTFINENGEEDTLTIPMIEAIYTPYAQ